MYGPMFIRVVHNETLKIINVANILSFEQHSFNNNQTIIELTNSKRLFIDEHIDAFNDRIYGLWLDNEQMAMAM